MKEIFSLTTSIVAFLLLMMDKAKIFVKKNTVILAGFLGAVSPQFTTIHSVALQSYNLKIVAYDWSLHL